MLQGGWGQSKGCQVKIMVKMTCDKGEGGYLMAILEVRYFRTFGVLLLTILLHIHTVQLQDHYGIRVITGLINGECRSLAE